MQPLQPTSGPDASTTLHVLCFEDAFRFADEWRISREASGGTILMPKVNRTRGLVGEPYPATAFNAIHPNYAVLFDDLLGDKDGVVMHGFQMANLLRFWSVSIYIPHEAILTNKPIDSAEIALNTMYFVEATQEGLHLRLVNWFEPKTSRSGLAYAYGYNSGELTIRRDWMDMHQPGWEARLATAKALGVPVEESHTMLFLPETPASAIIVLPSFTEDGLQGSPEIGNTAAQRPSAHA